MKRVLIADDESYNRLLLERMLRQKVFFREKDLHIFLAGNGKEALRIIRGDPNIDLVFLDIEMPVMNGQEALRQIKAIRPSLTVYAYTAEVSTKPRRQTIQNQGFEGTITKPLNLIELLYELEKTNVLYE